MKHSLKVVLSVLMIVGVLLSACAPASAPAPQVVTQVVTKEVQTVVTKEVQTVVTKEVQVEVTAAPPTPVPTATFPPPVQTGGEGCDPAATQVVWFVGLGAGTHPSDVEVEKAWVNKFNQSQKDVCVLLNVVYNTGSNSYDALRAMVAGGNAPCIVGPVGKAGRASFQGGWADLTPLAKAAGFDLSQYDPKLLDFVKDEGVLVGLPYALYPSFIYFNKKLFDEAKLPYPPQKVGDTYDGKPWNLDTFTQLAQKLTVDKNGNDATSPDFDPKNVTQFGFFEQWTDGRGVGAFFDGGLPYDPKTNTAVIPPEWVKAWKWFYDGIWNKHFMPTADYSNSDPFGKGNVFGSGNLAMSWVHTWYFNSFPHDKMSWDIAVVPQIDGKTTAKLHGDTFAIMKDCKSQDAAFKAMTAMVADPDLQVLYGGMPAKPADQAAFFAKLDQAAAPNKINWDVAKEMLKYPDLPNHEAWLPNLAVANNLFGALRTKMEQTPQLDMDAVIAQLKADLDAAYKAAPAK